MRGSANTLPIQARIEDGIARQTAHDPEPSARSFDAGSTERAAALHMIVSGHGSHPCKLPRRPLKRGRPRIEPGGREQKIRSLYLEGKTLAEIGEVLGLTRQHIGRLLRGVCGVRRSEGGKAIQTRMARENIQAKRAAYAMQHYDLPYEEYRRVLKLPSGPIRKYAYHRRSASDRGIGWEFTFAQWWKIWQQSGHWDQRGLGANRYCMCRLRDVGPYAVDNVYIATNVENLKDGWLNRGFMPLPHRREAA